MASQVAAAPPPIELERPEVPAALSRLVMRCLAKDPDDRYESADALLVDIERVARPTARVVSPAAQRQRRSRLFMGATATTVVLALGWFVSAPMRRERWARGTAIPEIQRLVNTAQLDSAYRLVCFALRSLATVRSAE